MIFIWPWASEFFMLQGEEEAAPDQRDVGSAAVSGLSSSSSGSGGMPAPVPPAEPLAELLARLGLAEGAGWMYTDIVTNQHLGYLRALASGRSIKATCRLHRHCSFFVNTQGDFETACKRLVCWLHQGLAADCATAEQHCSFKHNL
jgi:hypothetical protein